MPLGRGAGLSRLFVGPLLHQPEIEQLGHVMDSSSPRCKDIGRRNVPVDQPGGVGFTQGTTYLSEEVNGPLGRQRAMLTDQFAQIQARQQFHDVVERAVAGVSVIVDFDGVPVR